MLNNTFSSTLSWLIVKACQKLLWETLHGYTESSRRVRNQSIFNNFITEYHMKLIENYYGILGKSAFLLQ